MQGFGRTQQATNSVKLVIFISKLISDNVFINETINIYKKSYFHIDTLSLNSQIIKVRAINCIYIWNFKIM